MPASRLTFSSVRRLLSTGLIKDGKVIADTRTNLVRSGIGVGVRAGAPKPDISSVEAFKRALLNAKSIGYLPSGGVPQLVDRLGIADAIKSKVTIPDFRYRFRTCRQGRNRARGGGYHADLDDTRRRTGRAAPPEIQFYTVFTRWS